MIGKYFKDYLEVYIVWGVTECDIKDIEMEEDLASWADMSALAMGACLYPINPKE